MGPAFQDAACIEDLIGQSAVFFVVPHIHAGAKDTARASMSMPEAR